MDACNGRHYILHWLRSKREHPLMLDSPGGEGFQQPERTVGGHEGVLGGYSELTPLGLTELARRPSRLNMCVRTGVLQAFREANVSCWHVRT